MTKKVNLKLAIDIPDGLSVAALKEYVKTAIEGWSGGGHPEDPLFDWWDDDRRLKVTQIHRPKRKGGTWGASD